MVSFGKLHRKRRAFGYRSGDSRAIGRAGLESSDQDLKCSLALLCGRHVPPAVCEAGLQLCQEMPGPVVLFWVPASDLRDVGYERFPIIPDTRACWGAV